MDFSASVGWANAQAGIGYADTNGDGLAEQFTDVSAGE